MDERKDETIRLVSCVAVYHVMMMMCSASIRTKKVVFIYIPQLSYEVFQWNQVIFEDDHNVKVSTVVKMANQR